MESSKLSVEPATYCTFSHRRKSATNASCSTARHLQMAPNLPASQDTLIQHMIDDGRFTNRQIAEAADCSIPAVKAIKRNIHDFGSTTAPLNGGGRPPSMTSVMRDALLEYLLRKPNLYLDEMVVYLWGRVRTPYHKIQYQQDFTIGRMVEEKRASNS
jgi:hypothetical protein